MSNTDQPDPRQGFIPAPAPVPDRPTSPIELLQASITQYLSVTNSTPGELVLDLLDFLSYDSPDSDSEDVEVYLVLDADDATLTIEVS